MIKANELRIGSIVWAEDDFLCLTTESKIISISENKVKWVSIKDCNKGYEQEDSIIDLEGLPLTPEILESCGFVGEVWKDFKLPVLCEGQEITLTMCASADSWALCMKGYSEQGVDEFEIADIFKDLKKEKYPNGIGITHKENFMALKNIKYLHQLQNLYFALTETELEVNLTRAVTSK